MWKFKIISLYIFKYQLYKQYWLVNCLKLNHKVEIVIIWILLNFQETKRRTQWMNDLAIKQAVHRCTSAKLSALGRW